LCDRIHQSLSDPAHSLIANSKKGIVSMSISSVSAPPPVAPPPPVQTKPAKVNDDNDSRNATPPVQAALPPGQGTRVNIIA
jgi:hypothetical protein